MPKSATTAMDFSIIGYNIPSYVLAILAFALFWQLVYYFLFFARMAFYNVKPPQPFDQPISVIIAAKNEADNLIKNLPKVFAQDHPNFQVVVVNDGSWDRTAKILEEFQDGYENLHIVTIQDKGDNLNFSKKLAVTLGIKGAAHEHLIFIDADCYPADKTWLRNMAGGFANGKKVVLGYGAYERKKGLLNRLIRWDTLHIGMQYLSFARAGLPYMGVGRNMGYNKPTFFEVGGFKSHYHIESGDDDLFVNQVARRKNTAVIAGPECHTISGPKETFADWRKQKKRHLTTAGQYRFIHKFFLSLYPLTVMLFYLSFAALLFVPEFRFVALAVLGLRLLIQITIFSQVMRRLGEKDLLLLSPFLEVIMLVLNPMLWLSSVFTNKDAWRK
jgi:cellulose synthase/poly-beta-1,6-N-acetylglucosamine synthase-like glycosyltransferase